MTILCRQIVVGEAVVAVEIIEQSDGSFRIRADCQGELYEHSITIGDSEKPLSKTYDAIQAQKDLDAACDFAAHMAESKARIRTLKGKLK